MGFHQVIERLREAFPGVNLGDTADHGQYHDRAVGMTFEQVNDHIYASDGGRNTMWLYVNRPLNKICCGDKPWPEAEHFRRTGQGNP